MKKGDKVYTATVHFVEEWTFQNFAVVQAGSMKSPTFVQLQDERGTPRMEKASHVYPTRAAAIHARIAQLKKSIRSLTTAATNHVATVRKLQRELRKEES